MVAFSSGPNNQVTRISDTPFGVIKHVLEEYCTIYAGILLHIYETEFKLIWCIQKPFDIEEALAQICTEYGISIRPTLSQVLRGTKLTIEITLDGIK